MAKAVDYTNNENLITQVSITIYTFTFNSIA